MQQRLYFPGHRAGGYCSGASRITDEMLMSASEMLAQYSLLVLNGEGLVLPELKIFRKSPAQLPLRLAKWRSSKAWR
ncbi:malic enzyme-like NAD(P)-binding protein [Shigella sonnei]